MVDVRYATVFKLYPYQRVPAQDSPTPDHQSVVVVGGGPSGIAMALDLGRRNTPVLVIDDHDGIGHGSRAICFSRRTLEIADRLGCGDALLDEGVVWNVGRVYHRKQQLFEFNLSPEGWRRNPAFINLQQPVFEKILVEHVRHVQAQGTPIEIRGCNQLVGCYDKGDHVLLDVDTPEGPYQITCDWLIACDGAHSAVRQMLGLGFEGRVFEDNFLIADVRMQAPFPSERWFWFEPPFKHAGQSALLHKQPDDIWRIDFQLGWNIDRKLELDPDRIRTRIDAMLGEDIRYEIVWTSIYTFQCRRMKSFRCGRVLFAGDSAHQVSPFGARGANSGIQDIDNLGWKLALVRENLAPDALLDSYAAERELAADENILHSTRTTDFLTPKTEMSHVFRDAVLDLARHHAFARPLVNSGRLSEPAVYDHMPLNGPDTLHGPPETRVGAACVDTALDDGFLLDRLHGGFALLTIDAEAPDSVTDDGITVTRVALSTRNDPGGTLAAHYLGKHASAVYLIRPDQHIAARWDRFDAAQTRAALHRALARQAASGTTA